MTNFLTRPFSFVIKASPLVYLALTWSYLWQPTVLPFPLPTIIQTLLFIALILAATYLFREYSWELNLTGFDIAVFVGYVVTFSAFNFVALTQSLGGDELYHAHRSVYYLSRLDSALEHCSTLALWRDVPVNVLSQILSLLILLAGAGVLVTLRYLKRRGNVALYSGLVVLSALIVMGSHWVAAPVEPHPALRLLPLFVSQLFFGLTDFSFRFPGILAVAVVACLVQRAIRLRVESSDAFAVVIGFALYLIPIVFHVAAITEPSVWSCCVACVLFLVLHKAEQTRDERWMVLAGLLVGIGSLMRQNTILLWPVLTLFLWLSRSFVRRWVLVLAPAVFLFPYLLTVATIGHPVSSARMLKAPVASTALTVASTPSNLTTANAVAPVISDSRIPFPPLRNLIHSISSGIGPASIIKTNTVPWLLFLLLGMVWALRSLSTWLRFFYLTFLTGYGLFFAIGPNLWGMGRYQAEFVAPCIVLTLYLLALHAKRSHGSWLVVLVYLGAQSLFVNNIIAQDIGYDRFERRRISTECVAPYAEALNYVQRQSSAGEFVVLGAMPTNEPMLLWPRGFSFADWERFQDRSQKISEFFKRDASAAEFMAMLDQSSVDYLLVQYGTRRDRDGRSETQARLLKGFSEFMADGSVKPYVLQQTFVGTSEGVIDVYGRHSRRY